VWRWWIIDWSRWIYTSTTLSYDYHKSYSEASHSSDHGYGRTKKDDDYQALLGEISTGDNSDEKISRYWSISSPRSYHGKSYSTHRDELEKYRDIRRKTRTFLDTAPRTLDYWIDHLDIRDKNANAYIVIPTSGIVVPVVNIPEDSQAFRDYT
jgi:hypothetical protein